MKYLFPAIIKFDKSDEVFPNGVYLVSFPDLENCFTDGETLEEAYTMAQDVLNLTLMQMEDNQEPIPEPTPINNIHKASEDEIITFINADTLEYAKLYGKKAVKKTLSIPQWLDTIAQRNNINFSNVLQNALIRELNLQ